MIVWIDDNKNNVNAKLAHYIDNRKIVWYKPFDVCDRELCVSNLSMRFDSSIYTWSPNKIPKPIQNLSNKPIKHKPYNKLFLAQQSPPWFVA